MCRFRFLRLRLVKKGFGVGDAVVKIRRKAMDHDGINSGKVLKILFTGYPRQLLLANNSNYFLIPYAPVIQRPDMTITIHFKGWDFQATHSMIWFCTLHEHVKSPISNSAVSLFLFYFYPPSHTKSSQA